MIGYVLVGVVVLLLAAMLVQPKLGAVLVWLVVIFYPHLYMERLELLPWNIGYDDLFICLFFLIVALRCNMLHRTQIRFGLSLVGVLVLFGVWSVASLSGWSIMPELPAVVVVKPILKWVILVLLVYGLVHTIDNERDIRRAAYVYVGIMTLAGFSVIVHRWFPAQMALFATERQETELEYGAEYLREFMRPVGVLLNANGAAVLLGMTVMFTISLLRNWVTACAKLALLGCLGVMLFAIVLTRSRAGTIALGSALFLMCVFSQQRRYAGMLAAAVFGFIVVQPEWFLGLWYRLQEIYSPAAGGQWAGNMESRFETWRAFAEDATAQVWLFGQGRSVGQIRHGLTTHSSYVSALFVLGISGVIWMLVFFGILALRAWRLSSMRVEPYSSIAAAVFWALVVWAVAGVGIDMLLGIQASYTYMFYAILIERSCALAAQAQTAGQPATVQYGLTGPTTGGIAPLTLPTTSGGGLLAR